MICYSLDLFENHNMKMRIASGFLVDHNLPRWQYLLIYSAVNDIIKCHIVD